MKKLNVEYVELTAEEERQTKLKLIRRMLPLILMLFAIQLTYDYYVKKLPLCEQVPWLLGLLALIYATILGGSAWLLHFCIRILRAGELAMAFDIALHRRRIHRGWNARWRAIAGIIGALVAAGLFSHLAWYTYEKRGGLERVRHMAPCEATP